MQPFVKRAALTIVAAAIGVCPRPAAASAQHHYHGGGGHSVVFVGGYYYDPFFGPYPWWPAAAYPYAYYPVYDSRAELRILVTPREAAVYVDGFYAGIVDNFDGMFQRLPVSPGGHELVLYLDGYKTVHQTVYVTPGSTFKLSYKMEKLAAGETSEPPPVAPPVPAPPEGSARPPRAPSGPLPPGAPAPPEPPAPPQPGVPSSSGAIAIRVQPADAEIRIDGQVWLGSPNVDRLVVQVTDGTHRIEIYKPGYRGFTTEVTVRRGETTPLNVSLSVEGGR
jgi:PEGA domain